MADDGMMTTEERTLRWAHVKEMLGITDLPYEPERMSLTERYNKLPRIEVTFTRELTLYEYQMYRKIMAGGSWPVPEDIDD